MTRTLQYGYATVPTGQLHYAEMGEGDPLLLMHATSRSLRCYRRMMPLLAARYRTLAVDLPGFGNSHPLGNLRSVESIAECVVRFLDAKQIARANLFGLHLGNKVGAALAAGWPDRVGDVILMGQTHSLIVDRARRDQEIARLSQHHFAGSGGSENGLNHLQSWAVVNQTAQALWWTKPLLSGEAVRREDVEDARIRLADYLVGQPSLAQNYASVFAFDMTEAFRKIKARTLVVELLTPQEAHLGAQAPEMCRLMQRAQHAALQNADNMVLETRAEEVTEMILRFLENRVREPARP